jgi:uncharacterized protein YjiS (DUF1127 family)
MILLSAVLPAASAALRALRRTAMLVAKPAGSVLRALRNRRDIMRLADLDEHQLKDLGLTRTDVHGALAVSLLDDPSSVLCDIAGASHGQAALAASPGVRRVVMIKALPKEA